MFLLAAINIGSDGISNPPIAAVIAVLMALAVCTFKALSRSLSGGSNTSLKQQNRARDNEIIEVGEFSCQSDRQEENNCDIAEW